MSKITAEMWDKAWAKLSQVYRKQFEQGLVTEKCGKLVDRYFKCERSIELYNAIMELC